MVTDSILAHGKITVTGLRSGVVPVVAGGCALGVVIYGPLTGNPPKKDPRLRPSL